MTQSDLWQIYCSKNPSFAVPESQITFTGAGLKKIFDTTWEQAHGQGFRNGKAAAEMARTEPAKNPFEGIFGKGAF